MNTIAMSHKCAIDDCDKQTAIHLLMCRKHWYQVPRKKQQEVVRTYSPGQETRGRASAAYIAAAKAAIAAVENKLYVEAKPGVLNITLDELNDPAYDGIVEQITQTEDQLILNSLLGVKK